MIEIRRYTSDHFEQWNKFVRLSKNGTFLFDRNYLDYHSERFSDHSIMVYDSETLIATLPANQVGETVSSHGGLSYGGLVLQKDVKLEKVCSIFYHLLKYYAACGITDLVYKCVPSFFATFPSSEDMYIMYLLNAELIRRDSGCASPLKQRLEYQQRRLRSVKKAQKLDVRIVQSSDPSDFWHKALMPNLKERYNLNPVHSVDELKLLMGRFENNIKLFEARTDDILAGTVIYETKTVAHAQYIAATESGKNIGALDLLFHHLIQNTYVDKDYFSFGISNEENGRYLNRGLQDWKEGWGGRTYPLDFYKVLTTNYSLLQPYE